MSGSKPPRHRPRIILRSAIALGLLLALAGWVIFRRPQPPPPPEAEIAEEPAPSPPAPTPRPTLPPAPAPTAPPSPAPLEYMSDGVPIMPAGPDDPHPNTFVHPHPITPQHKRIFRENALLYQLNEAMDGKEAPRLRELLKQYRDEYPEDPHEMQEGYGLIADCIEHPGDATRARAQRYYDEEIASTLRRFVMRHCLEDHR